MIRRKRIQQMTRRGRIVSRLATAVAVLMIISCGVHLLLLGTLAFPGGDIIDGHYLVKDHGKIIELTKTQYWASYIHAVATISVVVAAFLTIGTLYLTGDLKTAWAEQ